MGLRLKYAGKNIGFDVDAAITQIECRKKFSRKLAATLSCFRGFYFPSILAGEQSTSDVLARFHSSLVNPGSCVADFTCGLGIDAIHMAKVASEVVAVDMNPAITEALKYNVKGLGLGNIHVVTDDCINYLDWCIDRERIFDVVFIDPARRAEDGSRIYALTQCRPDVVEMIPKLARICRRLVIKASPMLDIYGTIEILPWIPSAIVSLGTTTECKELDIVIDFDSERQDTVIKAVTMMSDGQSYEFSFTRLQEAEAQFPAIVDTLEDGDYIYEPFPSLMKTGAIKLIAKTFGLNIFSANTRLLYSSEKKENFQGNIYKVECVFPYASKVLKRFAKQYPRCEVAVRNFGISAEELRKKLAVKDGGDRRVYGITDFKGNKILAVCRKLQRNTIYVFQCSAKALPMIGANCQCH